MAGCNSNGNSHWSLPHWEKWQKALELRKAGLSHAEIASAIGYKSHDLAYRAVKSALLESIKEPAEEVRRLELERLDQLWSQCWLKIMDGDLKAVDVGLRQHHQRPHGLRHPACPGNPAIPHRTPHPTQNPGLLNPQPPRPQDRRRHHPTHRTPLAEPLQQSGSNA
jgi:hypothetical protein